MKRAWSPLSVVALGVLVLASVACPPMAERRLSVASLRAEAPEPYAPAAVLVTGQVNVPEGAVSVEAQVDFGDGSSEPLELAADGRFGVTHRYAAAGTFEIDIALTTELGDSGHDTTSVTLHERVHGVAIHCVTCDGSGVCAPQTCGSPANANVTLRASSQGGVGAPSYRWTFSDGTPPQTGEVITHQFTEYGGQTVTVVAQDQRASEGTCVMALDVQQGLQETVLIARAQGAASGQAPFTAKVAVTALGDGPMTLTVGWSDGEMVSFGNYPGDDSSVTASHTFANPGTYQVRVAAVDRHGNVTYEQVQFRATE